MQFGNLVSNTISSSRIHPSVQEFDLDCYGVVGVCRWYRENFWRVCIAVPWKTFLITIRLEPVRKTRSETFPIINKVFERKLIELPL